MKKEDPISKYVSDQINYILYQMVCIGCGLKQNVCKKSCNWYS